MFIEPLSVTPIRVPRLQPANRNRCADCGHGPLVCPTCGFSPFGCLECDGDSFALVREEPVNDQQIVVAPYQIPIIELRNWRGDDVFGAYHTVIVTSRVVEWLVSCHIGRAIVSPLAACRDGISKEGEKLLSNLPDMSHIDEPLKLTQHD